MNAHPPTLEDVNQQFDAVPLHRRIGLKIVQRVPHAIITMPLTDDVRGPVVGTVHGGMLATLADVTCAAALWEKYDAATGRPVTTDMHVRYYRQPRSGPITSEAHVVHSGRRVLSVECSIVDNDERELVRATTTYMILPKEGS